jgi:hypothetical protein
MTTADFNRYLCRLFGLAAAGALGLVALNWWIDPLQFYRRASYPALLIGEKRFQAPGIAKHYACDALVLGTSVSETIEGADAQEFFGWHSLNLAMQGASAREQHLALDVALRTGRVTNVLWDINYEYLRGSPDWVANYDGSFPFYFYDENPWNELPNYLLSVDTAKASLKILLRRCGVPTYQPRTPDEVFVWHNKKKFGLEPLRHAWTNAVAKRETQFARATAEYDLANLNANFDAHVLAVARAHPEVQFRLYFPPFARAYYANLTAANPQIFTNLIANKLHIIEQTRALPNVQLHDFQAQADIITNTANYCDLTHFSHAIARQLLQEMRAGHQQATSASVENLRVLVESTPAGLE